MVEDLRFGAQNSTSPIKASAATGSIDVVKAKHYFCRSQQMSGNKKKKNVVDVAICIHSQTNVQPDVRNAINVTKLAILLRYASLRVSEK